MMCILRMMKALLLKSRIDMELVMILELIWN